MRKNLIIGAITNYIWEDVAPFFKSYMRAGFENCECVMFTANMSARTIEEIRSCGVKVLPIPKRFDNCCVNVFRWDLYFEFLRDKKDIYDIIFTSDVRDAFFQHDIFKFCDSSKSFLGLAIEDATLEDPFSHKWITQRYGENEYEKIKNERVICDGTVWGSYDRFIQFTELMISHLDDVKYTHVHVSDQASTNYFIYHDKMFADCIVKSDNKTGYVMTIGLTSRENIKLDQQDNVLNGNGKIAAVVHQYDRKPDIIKKVIKKYCPEDYHNVDLYFEAVICKRHGTIWRLLRYFYKVRKKGLLATLKASFKSRFNRLILKR